MKWVGALLLFCLPALGWPVLADEPPALQGRPVSVRTVADETITSVIVGLADDKLSLAGEPVRIVPLADIEQIEFGKPTATTGDVNWVGQDNFDLVQNSTAFGGNGIQDLHFRATNLKPLAIKQIVVECKLPASLFGWRLDTSTSPHWRLALGRGELAATADINLEPPEADCFGRTFDFTFIYTDGSNVRASVVATTHTSHQLKVDRTAQFGMPSPAVNVPVAAQCEFYLAEGNRLPGEIASVDEESLELVTGWKQNLRIPLLRVRGLWRQSIAPAGARADFDKALNAPPSDDMVYLLGSDQSLTPLTANVLGASEGKLSLRYSGEVRSVKLERVVGIVFAAHPKLFPIAGPFQTVALASGGTLSGRLRAIDSENLEFETIWQARVKLPLDQVLDIRFRNGNVTSLADLEPAMVEEVPYFGRVMSWRRDQGFDEGPVKVKGKLPTRSIAMHSRCLLTYDLDGNYETFRATVGFDDAAGDRGRVVCKVRVDGRDAFAEQDLRADQEPKLVEVSLAGAKQLTLEVDFGQADDIGDRVVWAEPRLFRKKAE